MIHLTNGCNAFKVVSSPTRAEYLLRHGWQEVPEREAETAEETGTDVSRAKPSPRKKIVVEKDVSAK